MVQEYPYFSQDFAKYPTEKQRLRFIRAYLDELGSLESPKKIMREVESFSLVIHYFWSLWGLINAETSNIPFGHWVRVQYFIISSTFNAYMAENYKIFNAITLNQIFLTYLTIIFTDLFS